MVPLRMTKNRHVSTVVLGFLALSLASGCGGEGSSPVRVGDQTEADAIGVGTLEAGPSEVDGSARDAEERATVDDSGETAAGASESEATPGEETPLADGPGDEGGTPTASASETPSEAGAGDDAADDAELVDPALPPDRDARRLLLRDEGVPRLHLFNLANPGSDWHVPIPTGRDLQLVGGGRALIGTDGGYEERDLATGEKLAELTTFPGTIAAQRLRNRNTLLVGANWQGQSGIVLVEVDASGGAANTTVYPGFDYVRLVRETPSGTFLVTSDRVVFEGDRAGNLLWQVAIDHPEPHAWMALRLASGDTLVGAGYAAGLQLFSPEEQLTATFTGPDEVSPYYYAGFQVLADGHFVVTNWQGHGEGLGVSGVQVLEYEPSGNLVWSWQQDPAFVASLQAVIVLDGLDLSRLHVEGPGGALVPVGGASSGE